MTGGVDADSSELMPISTSLESEQIANDEEATDHIDNLTGGVDVDADFSELMPVSTSLESELVADDEETTPHIVEDSIDMSKMEESAMVSLIHFPYSLHAIFFWCI